MNLKKENLSDLIIKKIKKHIEINNLKVGDRLPTEQQMATKFGVSRVSIREATKALHFLGIIRAAPSRGLTIGPADVKKINEILSFHLMFDKFPKEMLFKARMVIEIGSLRYAMDAVASDHMLYEKLIAMCDTLDQTKDAAKFIKGDTQFHRTLVEACKVSPLVIFNDIVNAFFSKYRREMLGISEKDFVLGSHVHREIVNSLRNRDLIGAEKALYQHMDTFDKLSKKQTITK
jgi:GntR family transcriptional regulator, transcriptional repressor for pyruvate dehydrogenase complex